MVAFATSFGTAEEIFENVIVVTVPVVAVTAIVFFVDNAKFFF